MMPQSSSQGSPLDPRRASAYTDVSAEAYALLAQANLLRIRGSWMEATQKCMEAMRLSPGNVAAQSLLGDIYENQGLTDDAIQWYRMSLDANPNSQADRQKLSRLLARRGESIDGIVFAVPQLSDPLSPSVTRARSIALGVTASLLGIVVLLVILTSFVEARARLRSGLTQPAPSNVDSQPVFINPGDPNQTTPEVPRDSYEMELGTALASATTALDPTARFTDVFIDPRTGRLTLTYLLVPPSTPTRSIVRRAALQAAQIASKVPESSLYSNFTVRFLYGPDVLSGSAAGASLVYIGDISRAGLTTYSGDPSNIPDQQMPGVFANEWWGQGLDSSPG